MASSSGEPLDHAQWPQRALILAATGAVFGFLVHELTSGTDYGTWTGDPVRLSLAACLAVSGIAFAFSLERARWTWSLAFAAAGGAVAGFVTWWNGSPGGWGSDDGWQFFASLAAVAISVPLFQAARDAGRLRFDTAAVHGHVWTNLILWAAAWAFVGATILLTFLLSALFSLIGIDFLEQAMREGWFVLTLACGALGGAVGLLRDRDNVTGVLQRVVRAILSVLAPVLALGLVFFVLALPVTGLGPLWEKTSATTPILLACILGAVFLANAVLGNTPEEEARAPALRWSAMALAATLLPLALVAAISTAKRIGQHGFTPDRLWAAVFVAIALAVAAVYLLALVRGRLAWAAPLRRMNVGLAAGICLLALFLALPIVSFGALSARDQVARLESGRIPPERFDWRALRFEFGPAGKRALERLAATGPQALRAHAAEALAAKERWDVPAAQEAPAPAPIVTVENGAVLPAALHRTIALARTCTREEQQCRLAMVGADEAVLLWRECDRCEPGVRLYRRAATGNWANGEQTGAPIGVAAEPRVSGDVPGGPVEIRKVEKRQVFVGGRPIGNIFD